MLQIGRHIFSLSDEELDLRAKVRDMKDAQSHISMMDEFARYMKLQRQIDKLMSQIKDSGKYSYESIYCITVSTHTVSQLLLIKTFFLQCLQITIRTVQGITALTEKHFSAVSKSVSCTQYTDKLLKCSSPRLMEQGLGKRHFFSSSTSSQHFHFRVRLLTAHTQQCTKTAAHLELQGTITHLLIYKIKLWLAKQTVQGLSLIHI